MLKNKLRIIHSGGRESEYYKQEIKRASVDWMYNDPPGTKEIKKQRKEKQVSVIREETFQKTVEKMKKDEKRRAELEYELTLGSRERQIRRFEFFKNAPVEGKYVLELKLNLKHKPFGKMIKDIKCLKCNTWGHRIGDAECPLTHINPFNPYRILEQGSNESKKEAIVFKLPKRKKCFVKQFYKIQSEFSMRHQLVKEPITIKKKKKVKETLKQSLEKLDELVKSLKHKK